MPALPFSLFSRRARRPRLTAAVALVALLSVTAACQGTKTAPPMGPPPPPPPPDTYCAPSPPDTAAEYQQAFDGVRAANAGHFVASDGGVPAPLPDGRILWFFGDTVVGRWTPGGPVNPFFGLANNSWIVQQGACFTPKLEPIPDLPGGEWVWPSGAVVDQATNLLHVIGQHMRPAGGPFPFELVRVVVVTFSLPSLTLQQPVWLRDLPTPDKNPNYGETVFVDGNTVYAYGRIRQPGFPTDHHFVAKTTIANLLTGSWEYWKDDNIPVVGDPSEEWTTVATDRDPIAFDGPDVGTIYGEAEGPVAGFPVALRAPGAYLGSALHFDVIPDDLETWHAPAPQGPWDIDAQEAFDVPDYTVGDRFAYGGRVILGGTLPNVTNPVALWSVNHESFDAVLANPDVYKVVFDVPVAAALTPP